MHDDGHDDDDELIERAVALARDLQERAAALQTPQERRQQAELDRMIRHPADKATLVSMTDRAFRSASAARSVEQLTHILDVQGIPRFFSPFDRALLRGFEAFGGYLPGVAGALVREKMQSETASVVLPAEPEELAPHLLARRDEGVRMNVNFLGEELLGEEEAQRRLALYADVLAWPEIEVVSVKISTIFSQIDAIAREQTVATLSDRLAPLYRAAADARFRRADGSLAPKFVYLDMEEYRDLAITADAFVRTLDRPSLAGVSAGLALQAYLPDSFAVQRRITEWAARRVAAGGASVALRIVKGANLEMERVEASLRGWPQAPFRTKRETDANYRRMLRYGLEPEHARAVRIGVASHNLFDLAYGLVLAEARGVLDHVQFEMLEGMASPQRRALAERTRDLLLYAPACRREDFLHAIGYLVRRLDENTGPDNFLRHAFQLAVDSDDWRALEAQFRAAFDAIPGLPDTPRRTQDRRAPPVPTMDADRPWTQFVNEPDTDFSLPHHAAWAASIYAAWRDRCGARAPEAPLVIDGREVRDRPLGESPDPSRPGVISARYRIATAQDVEDAVACARADAGSWRSAAPRERGAALRRAAQQIRIRRADLMGIALAECGKVLAESDVEVSEAVDYCAFYARAAEDWHERATLEITGLGVVVVAPPWNFPIAIPAGGVAAALAAGNTVILKPAPEAVVTSYLLCEAFWAAGISRRTLQFVFGADAAEATQLVTHVGVDAVVLTGGTETALHLRRLKPAMHLLAETGGKNATIVSAMADRELAIKHIVRSAFGHAGQKCSATSLLILDAEVYDDAGFRRGLCDAAASMPVGSAWDSATKVGPLIRPPSGKLARALTELDPGEEWALASRPDRANLNLWSPGIKWGVRPGSVTHTTEFFGPVLGVMRARDLDEAVVLANATGYGLTSAIHTLDDREQRAWADAIRAGNLYVNRGTTGAIVLRQPFGGMGRSVVGPGVKTGSPNYLVPLMRIADAATPGSPTPIEDSAAAALLRELESLPGLAPADLERVRAAVASYDRAMRSEFGAPHDHFLLIGQDNFRRYLPLDRVRIRVCASDTPFENLARVCAARLAGCHIMVSYAEDARAQAGLLRALAAGWGVVAALVEESDNDLGTAIRDGAVGRIRYAGDERVPDAVREAAAEAGIFLATAPVLADGRIELLWYLREQSLCIDYHRYGNLGARAGEPRSPTA